MLQAYKDFWKRYTDFSGHSSRSDYWWVYLCQTIISVPITILLMSKLISAFLAVSPYISDSGETIGISDKKLGVLFLSELLTPGTIFLWTILLIYGLACFIPQLALSVRRLRDAGFHWAFLFFNFIPYVGPFIVLIFYMMPSKQHPTQVTPTPSVASPLPPITPPSNPQAVAPTTTSAEPPAAVTPPVATEVPSVPIAEQQDDLESDKKDLEEDLANLIHQVAEQKNSTKNEDTSLEEMVNDIPSKDN